MVTIIGRIGGTGTRGPLIIPGVGLITRAGTVTTTIITAVTITHITVKDTTAGMDMVGMDIAAATDTVGTVIAAVTDIMAAPRAMDTVPGIAATAGTDPVETILPVQRGIRAGVACPDRPCQMQALGEEARGAAPVSSAAEAAHDLEEEGERALVEAAVADSAGAAAGDK